MIECVIGQKLIVCPSKAFQFRNTLFELKCLVIPQIMLLTDIFDLDSAPLCANICSHLAELKPRHKPLKPDHQKAWPTHNDLILELRLSFFSEPNPPNLANFTLNPLQCGSLSESSADHPSFLAQDTLNQDFL
jgi:hypothetical protein